MLIVSDWLSRNYEPISEPITVARGMQCSQWPLVSLALGWRMETRWSAQRGMGVLLAEEGTVDTGQAKLQASSFTLEQGRLVHQGDPQTLEGEFVEVKVAVIALHRGRIWNRDHRWRDLRFYV